MSALLDAALEYALRGWAVLPLNYLLDSGVCSCEKGVGCKTPAKHPLGLLVPRGEHQASTDEATIREWLAALLPIRLTRRLHPLQRRCPRQRLRHLQRLILLQHQHRRRRRLRNRRGRSLRRRLYQGPHRSFKGNQ